MGYIEDHLITDERVIYTTKLHWIIFAWPVIFLGVGILMVANQSGGGWFFILIGFVWGLINFIPYSSSEFGVTNRRVLIAVRLLGQRSLEIMLPKIEGIGVNQGMFGTIFGYGTIVVTGTGGTREPFPKIAAPQEFRRRVQEQIASHEQQSAGRSHV